MNTEQCLEKAITNFEKDLKSIMQMILSGVNLQPSKDWQKQKNFEMSHEWKRQRS